jgi:hypothetical protein
MTQIYKVISSSFNTEYTGSIEKIYAISGVATDMSALARIEYGAFQFNQTTGYETGSAFTPTSTITAVSIVNGTVLDGPIARVKTGATGGFLIYERSDNQ